MANLNEWFSLKKDISSHIRHGFIRLYERRMSQPAVCLDHSMIEHELCIARPNLDRLPDLRESCVPELE